MQKQATKCDFLTTAFQRLKNQRKILCLDSLIPEYLSEVSSMMYLASKLDQY